jgi:hypothetical protein
VLGAWGVLFGARCVVSGASVAFDFRLREGGGELDAWGYVVDVLSNVLGEVVADSSVSSFERGSRRQTHHFQASQHQRCAHARGK